MIRIYFIFFYLITTIGFSQQTENVDFLSCKANLSFTPNSSKVIGIVNYKFKVLKQTDSIFIDAVKMTFDNFYLDDNKIDYINDGNKLWLKHSFEEGKTYQVSFNYEANPKKAMYFIDWDTSTALSVTNDINVTSSDSDFNQNRIEKKRHSTGSGQVWTQGQGKYTSNWLPSIDNMNDKMEFDLTITFDKYYEVISNGKLINKQINDSIITWHYDMQNPMSSYLVALAIGKYNKKVEYSKSGIPLEMYYYPEDSLKVEPTYRYTKHIFDFLEDEIGVSYPWQNYKQIPVKDFLYAGMENTSATIFADSYVIDSIAFVDKNYVNVNAHELAHQWFGDLVTETSGTHHWLQEGFATYYALLAEKDIFGDDYYYWRLYEYAQELLEQDKAGLSTSLLDPKSSSTTFYKKGAWVLHLLREKVGDKAFKKAIKNYLEKHQFKNVDTHDFIDEVEKASAEDLSEFVEKWLISKELNYDEMEGFFFLTSIHYKGFIQLDCEKSENDCFEFFNSSEDRYLKAEVIRKLGAKWSKNLFNSEDIKVRQAIAQTLTDIPLELKADYETLLDDKSYATIETALFNLWLNFLEDQHKYLNKTKGIYGFNDNNIRILWLALALITKDFENENKQQYFNELTDYTSPKYGFEIRQKAFFYLQQIQACNDVCKENLKQATTHHSWQFSKFAKELLKILHE